MKSENTLKIYGLVPESIVDGPGFRYVVFVQGCPHNCVGCHNPESHDFNNGRIENIDQIFEEICENPLLSGVTFSGGEPFCQASALAALGKKIKNRGLNLMVYSGWTFEELMAKKEPAVHELLKLADYLVDGKFNLDKRDLTLAFRGSSNQRVIDLNKTRKFGKVITCEL